MEGEGEWWILEIGFTELVNQINIGGYEEDRSMPHPSFQIKISPY